MGILILTCRVTGRDYSTGIHTDQESFKKFPDTEAKASCPHCGRMHRWWTHDARLIEGVVQDPVKRAS
jgi:hypothetical protein